MGINLAHLLKGAKSLGLLVNNRQKLSWSSALARANEAIE
jgi:hypothetical protein